ncbi:hypothetical protein OG756_41205 [Streptomyces sp. NBC_01310]|uniref:hypothetical protein n=1 Tax=Streptomyces sp. NBC_01310 TaxID=2903820 RepID=UPI0035B5C897|nr:hypothetical protein OG756_00185 [Streptomyces sp. NBC_01310]WSJ63824.1 hypothetical protein OG756_41205 [Streptomyces sp. NBC_01310]
MIAPQDLCQNPQLANKTTLVDGAIAARARQAVIDFVRRRRVRAEERHDPQEVLPGLGPQPHRPLREPLEDDVAVRTFAGTDPGQGADAFLGVVGEERQDGLEPGSSVTL